MYLFIINKLICKIANIFCSNLVLIFYKHYNFTVL